MSPGECKYCGAKAKIEFMFSETSSQAFVVVLEC